MKKTESGYDVYHIMDLIQALGEDGVRKILSDFSSEYKSEVHNEETESFLRNNALDFTRKKISVTYLALDNQERAAGFFTLTHKPVTIRRDIQISKNAMRKLDRHAKYDPAINAYHASAFLLAQFGKNYSLPETERMSGQNLMRQTLLKIEDIQRQIGGGIIFLEAEEHRELLDFYRENAFAPFAERYSDMDNVKYVQMLRLL